MRRFFFNSQAKSSNTNFKNLSSDVSVAHSSQKIDINSEQLSHSASSGKPSKLTDMDTGLSLSELKIGSTLTLPEDVYHHWCRVLRAKVAENCILFDGMGGEVVVTLEEISSKSATVRLLTQDDSDYTPEYFSTVAIVMSRGDRMDFAIQKSTELGATAIQLLTSQYGEVKLKANQIDKKLNHWQQVALSASEQCGLNRPTLIFSPISTEAWLEGEIGKVHEKVDYLLASPFYQSYIAYDSKAILPLVLAVPNQEDDSNIDVNTSIVDKFSKRNDNDSNTLPRFDILIGAEGGFSETEYKLARTKNYLPWQLGNRILRTETAPIVALSTLLFVSTSVISTSELSKNDRQ